jgi:hypothetical protein
MAACLFNPGFNWGEPDIPGNKENHINAKPVCPKKSTVGKCDFCADAMERNCHSVSAVERSFLFGDMIEDT